MQKKLSLAVGVLMFASTAWAGPLTLSVSNGGWVGGSAVNAEGACVDVDNRAGTLQDEVRWGGGSLVSGFAEGQYTVGGDACYVSGDDYLAPVSGYNFDPFDGTYTFPGSASPFSLGTFQHENFSIQKAITGIDYNLSLSTGASVDPLAIDLSFIHDETDNACNTGPNCSDDTVTVVLPQAPTKLQVGGDTYWFQLLGFSTTGLPGTFTSAFSSPENGTNTSQLWAQISPHPIPEPGTLVLLGSGLVGIGAAARRRMRKPVS